jgi:hypothetical protein
MMNYLMKGKKLDEATVRQWMNQIECGQNSSKEGVRSFDDKGGNILNYTGVLAEKCNIKAHTIKNEGPVRRWITTAKPTKPVLAHVYWWGVVSGVAAWLGSGHTVIAVSHHGTNTIFLDPGLGIVEIADADLLAYDVNYGHGLNTGVIRYLGQPA